MIIGYSDGERKTAPRLRGIWVRQGRQVTLDRLDDVADHFYSAAVSSDLQEESPKIYNSGLLK